MTDDLTTDDLKTTDLQDDRIKDVIRQYLKTEGFKDRKLTDTPTDDLQVVNKAYVDANSGGVIGRMYLAGAQTVSVTSPNYEKVLVDTSSFSSGVTIDTVNSRITIITAGYYQINGAIQYNASDVASGCAIAIYVNGSQKSQNWVAAAKSNGNTTAFVSDILSLSVSDYVEIYTTKIFANGAVQSGSAFTYLSLAKV